MPALTLITALPTFASPEEHRAFVGSTPASFSDIPPVLKHREDNVYIKLDPPVAGFSDEDTAHGTLYVITSALVFMSTTGRGLQIEYPAITLHAISRGQNGPSIYCQLDVHAGDEATTRAAPIDDEDDTELQELTILPQTSASLEPIFESLSLCAALHPDKHTEDDEEPDDAFIDASAFDTFTGDETQELSELGRAALAHMESIIYDPHDLMSQANGVNGAEEEEVEGQQEPSATSGEEQAHSAPAEERNS